MSQLNSALYRGRVRHTRLKPLHHDFEYRVYYGLFDIDELDAISSSLRLFSTKRPNVYGLDIGFHGPADGSPLRPWAESVLSDAGIELEGGSISLLAFPKILGYVFNPISVWYCRGPGGDLRAVLYEVRNTFGERHVYVIDRQAGMQHRFDKQLHVSPFNDMDETYRFTIGEPGDRLSIAIEQSGSDGVFFRAGMALERMDLTDGNLIRLFLANPLLTLKVIAGIHLQALRLWMKGARYRPRPEPPANTITVVPTAGVPA